MNVTEFAKVLNAKVLSGEKNSKKQVGGLYICDLLSRVMSHASKDDAWITVHTHLNVVAVAVLTEVSCIIIPEGIAVETATLEKAGAEGIIIISTELSAYEISCRAYEILKV